MIPCKDCGCAGSVSDECRGECLCHHSAEERVVAKNTRKKNKTWSVDDEHLRRTSNYIRGSLKGRFQYRLMMSLMFVETVLWTFLDIVRAWRMKVAEIITKNRHNDRH